MMLPGLLSTCPATLQFTSSATLPSPSIRVRRFQQSANRENGADVAVHEDEHMHVHAYAY